MIKAHNYVTVISSGYGHKKVTVYLHSGEQYSATTSDMHLIDKYNSDDDNEANEAKMQLIKYVLSNNGIEEFNIIK